MSWEATEWAWSKKTSPTNKLVLLCIAEHAHKDGGESYPSIERIAEMTGLGRRTVIRAIQSLKKAQLIQVVKRRRHVHSHNVYSMPLNGKVPQWHPGSVTVAPYPPINPQIKNYKERTLISEDWKMSESNVRLAASLGIPIPRGGGDWVEDEFRDWALMYGHKSSNWQASCATFLKKYAHEEKARRLH